MYTYICIYTYTHTYIHVYKHINIHIYICICIYLYIINCALMCVCVCRNIWGVCVYSYHTRECVMSHAHHTHSCTHVCALTRVSICKNVCEVCVNEYPTHKRLIQYIFWYMWNEAFYMYPTHIPAHMCVCTHMCKGVQECVKDMCVCVSHTWMSHVTYTPHTFLHTRVYIHARKYL